MKEILLTSSVLILALLLLRLLFRKTISRQVQYALWGLVALRLLVPVSLPAMEHNVLTAAEPVTARITAPALYVTPYRETIVSAPPRSIIVNKLSILIGLFISFFIPKNFLKCHYYNQTNPDVPSGSNKI